MKALEGTKPVKLSAPSADLLRAPGVGRNDRQRRGDLRLGQLHNVGPAHRAQARLGIGGVGSEPLLRRIDEALDRPVGAVEVQRAGIEQRQYLEALASIVGEVLGGAVSRVGRVRREVGDPGAQFGAGRIVRHIAADGRPAVGILDRCESERIGNRRPDVGQLQREPLRRTLRRPRPYRIEIVD